MTIFDIVRVAIEAVVRNIEESDVEYVKRPGKPAEFRVRFNGQPPIEGSARSVTRLESRPPGGAK